MVLELDLVIILVVVMLFVGFVFMIVFGYYTLCVVDKQQRREERPSRPSPLIIDVLPSTSGRPQAATPHRPSPLIITVLPSSSNDHSRSQSISYNGQIDVDQRPSRSVRGDQPPPLSYCDPKPELRSISVDRISPQQTVRPMAPPSADIDREDSLASVLPVDNEDPPPSYDENVDDMAYITLCRKHKNATPDEKPFIMEYDMDDGCMCTKETFDLLQYTQFPSLCRVICDDDQFPYPSKRHCRCANPARAGQACLYDVCEDRDDRIMCTRFGQQIEDCHGRLVNEAGRTTWPECPCLNGGNRTEVGGECQCAKYYFGKWCQVNRPPSATSTSTVTTSTVSTRGPRVVVHRQADDAKPAGKTIPVGGIIALVFVSSLILIMLVLFAWAVNAHCKQERRKRADRQSDQSHRLPTRPSPSTQHHPSPLSITVLPPSNDRDRLPHMQIDVDPRPSTSCDDRPFIPYSNSNREKMISIDRRSPQQPTRPTAPPPEDIDHEDPSAPMLPENHEDPPPSYDEVTGNRPTNL